MKAINIAIDGYAGCGKSTLAKDLAAELKYTFVDSGAMYRGIALYFIERGIDVNNQVQVAQALSESPILSFEAGSNALLLNGLIVEDAIREDRRVAESVSDVAALPAVREYLKDQQIALASGKGVVMEGRDIGTVIMPNAELKVFITASIAVRVKRRLADLAGRGIQSDPIQVKRNLLERDQKDAGRKEAPLRKAHDAVVLDTTEFDRTDQLNVVMAMWRPLVFPEEYLQFIL